MVKKKTARQKIREKVAKQTGDKGNEDICDISSLPSILGSDQQRKVGKKITKQLTFLKKLKENQALVSLKKTIHKKKHKKRHSTSGKSLNDLSSLADFLPDLASMCKDSKPPKVPKVLHNRSRQKLVVNESKQFSAVLAHPVFQANPFAAIHKHLLNTIPNLESKQKTVAAKDPKKSKVKRKKAKQHDSMDLL